jgi:hypothetical protein
MHYGFAVAVGSYTTAVEHCDCDMHDHRACVALVSNMDCATAAAATDNTRATPLSTTKRWNACVRATEAPERSAQTRTIEPNQWQVL